MTRSTLYSRVAHDASPAVVRDGAALSRDCLRARETCGSSATDAAARRRWPTAHCAGADGSARAAVPAAHRRVFRRKQQPN